jgi:hypothetical protein
MVTFSTLPLLFNFGSVVGPMIGGYFATPNLKNPYHSSDEIHVFEKISCKYPYLLSNLVVACFLWFSCICGALFLEETHEELKNKRDYGVDLGDYLLTKLGYSCPSRPWNKFDNHKPIPSPPPSSPAPTEDTALLNDNASITSEESIQAFNGDATPMETRIEDAVGNAIIRTYSNNSEITDLEENDPNLRNQKSKIDYSGAFTHRVLKVMCGYFILSLHSVTYSQFLPLFLAGSFKPDKLKFPFTIVGGFGMNTKTIGTLISSTGIMGILIILLIFPFLDNKLGTINGYRLSTSIFPLVYFLVPFTIFTVKDYNDIFPEWFSTIVLYSLTALRTLASATGAPQINILSHRASTPRHRAYVNSTIMTSLSFANFSAPLLFGWLMSVGEKYQIGWLIWWIISCLALGGMIQLFWLEDYDDE